jgi:AraC family transcriptional regulator of adaptative response / DNA-3-methyladenine glycosylase II
MLGNVMDDNHCYRVASSRDGRFDGAFVTAVTTTGIYCRPSCPAMTPKRNHVRFFPTPAAAQEAGFRACKRCRPDAAPGSPEWDSRADLVARAVRLIGDGVVEREGLSGLSRRLGYSPRQLHRLVFAELGTGPLRLAMAHRIQHARALLETTDLAISDVVWAAGFGSVRQFNDRIRQVYALSPTELRRQATGPRPTSGPERNTGTICARLAYRPPLDLPALLRFLGLRAIPGVESFDGSTYNRVLRLPHGLGTVSIGGSIIDGPRPFVSCELQLDDVRDYATAISRVRRLLDLDADPTAVAEALGPDPVLGRLVRANPGLRLPSTVDGPELAMRAILGQQISVAGARTLAGRLTLDFGEPLPAEQNARSSPLSSPLRAAFPTAERLAEADPTQLPLPRGRATALQRLAREVAAGRLNLDPGADRDDTEASLLGLPGIGPWTASYIRMRGLGDPDVFLPSDLGLTRTLASLAATGTHPPDPVAWKPWRSYAVAHLWAIHPTRLAETGAPKP